MASLCVTDRIPLLGTLEAMKTTKTINKNHHRDRDGGGEERDGGGEESDDGDEAVTEEVVVVTLRLAAILPKGLWSAGARLWTAENARRSRGRVGTFEVG